MEAETKRILFEIAKSQDALMQNLSSELSVKTSLYLVFSVFLFNAAFQISNFARDIPGELSGHAIHSAGIGALLALLGAILLLVAALVRNYSMFPLPETAKWLEDTEEFLKHYPESSLQDPEVAIREILEETILANKVENERKASWITRGAWFLIFSVPIITCAGILAFLGYVIEKA
jgi:hypothetical protein